MANSPEDAASPSSPVRSSARPGPALGGERRPPADSEAGPRSRPFPSPASSRDGQGPISAYGGPKRILVIDDSRTVYLAVRSALALDGHVVERLDCFVDLPRAVRDNPPDLIVLDLRIPELPGLAMGKYIRKHEPRRIPILIHTAAPSVEARAAVIDLEASGIVPKGATPEELRDAVSRALRSAW